MLSMGNMGRMMRLKGIRRVSCGVAPSVRDITHRACLLYTSKTFYSSVSLYKTYIRMKFSKMLE